MVNEKVLDALEEANTILQSKLSNILKGHAPPKPRVKECKIKLPVVVSATAVLNPRPRRRRLKTEVSRYFKCIFCACAYEKIQHLNVHLVSKQHGKRLTTIRYNWLVKFGSPSDWK